MMVVGLLNPVSQRAQSLMVTKHERQPRRLSTALAPTRAGRKLTACACC